MKIKTRYSKFKGFCNEGMESGLAGVLATILIVSGGLLVYNLRWSHIKPKTNIDSYSLYNGAVTLRKIEEDRESFLPYPISNDVLLSIKYQIECDILCRLKPTAS